MDELERTHQLNGLRDLLREFKLLTPIFNASKYEQERLKELCDTMAEFSHYNTRCPMEKDC